MKAISYSAAFTAPLKPSFNHLSANFADDEYGFVGNSITVYDIDHAGLVGGGAGSPLFLKSNVNLAGTSSKSQAGVIASGCRRNWAALRRRSRRAPLTGRPPRQQANLCCTPPCRAARASPCGLLAPQHDY
jgi:hypothetical protein